MEAEDVEDTSSAVAAEIENDDLVSVRPLPITEEEDETSKSVFRFLFKTLGKIWQSPIVDRSSCWYLSVLLSVVAADDKQLVLIDDVAFITEAEEDEAAVAATKEDFVIPNEDDEAGVTVRPG